MKSYYIGTISKTAEEDNYKDGCVGKIQDFGDIDTIKAETLPELISEFRSRYNGAEFDEYNNWVRWAIMEDKDGTEASPSQLERWKSGDLRLWCADYFMSIEYHEAAEVAPEVLQNAINGVINK